MMKKRLLFLIAVGIFLLFIVYWFYFSKPTPLPSNEQIVEEINSVFPEAAANFIQDTITVEERYVLVPYISNKGEYGLSYWAWKKHNWIVESIDTRGEPKVWKIDRNDPSSFHLVWNIHPKDHLGSIDFYLIRDRGYHITNGNEYYYPRIQMEKKVSFQEKSYGLMQLPEDWVTFIKTSAKVESAKQPNFLSHNFFPDQNMFFGWIPYDQTNKEVFPEGSVNSNSYSNGNLTFEYVMILNKKELEF
ncbi:hypothetical protein [Neobacillus sp. D3-1R]|uniref:hypothetical protein n=1 Tax=Neobacillus sp. D3-1R TaxID=3445778 RepID=UPI003FA0BD4A